MPTFTSIQHGDKTRLKVTESVTNYGGATRLTVETIGKACMVQLHRVKIKRTAGAAANFTPRVFSAAAGTSGSVDQQFVGSATAIADLFDVACEGVIFKTDSLGRLYLEPGFDAGANNAADIALVVEVF